MRYRDFRLQIVPAGEGYALQAFSPQGEDRAFFVPPFSAGEIRDLNAALSRSARKARNLLADGGEEPSWSPEMVGEKLFSALFPSEILRLYERSLVLLGTEPDAGLRLEIMMDPREPRLAPLQALPWELMRQPGAPDFLALSRRRPIVRYLTVPRPVSAARRPAVLRILAVACSPRGLRPLDLARELRNLKAAVGAAATIEIVEPETPTLAALRKALLDQECHVVHFMGQGGTIDGQAERVLYFETENGDPDPVRGTDLINKLDDFPRLRLAVLNACESAAVSTGEFEEGFEPFSGVAGSLLMGGLPAVVAMQLPVTDQAVIAFSRVFYQRLAAGDPVDAAVAEGRQAMHSANAAGFEWATPVLFMRTPNGELYPEKDLRPERSWRDRVLPWLVAALILLLLLGGAGIAARNWWVERLVSEGAAFAQHGQWDLARSKFWKAAKYAPRSAEVLSNLAGAQEQLGSLPSAERNYRAAARLEPTSAEHLYNLGRFLNFRGNYHDAYEALAISVKRDPNRVDAYGELAAAAQGLSLLDDARTALQTALRIDPSRPALHRRLGEVELRAGNPAAAIEHLKEASQRYPLGERGLVETVSLLVQAYDRLGDRASICREIEEYRRLDRSGAMPWAPPVDEAAERNHCPVGPS